MRAATEETHDAGGATDAPADPANGRTPVTQPASLPARPATPVPPALPVRRDPPPIVATRRAAAALNGRPHRGVLRRSFGWLGLRLGVIHRPIELVALDHRRHAAGQQEAHQRADRQGAAPARAARHQGRARQRQAAPLLPGDLRGARPRHLADQLQRRVAVVTPRAGRPVHHWPMQGPLVWEMAQLARDVVPNVQVAAEVVDRWYTDPARPVPHDRDGPLVPAGRGRAAEQLGAAGDDEADVPGRAAEGGAGARGVAGQVRRRGQGRPRPTRTWFR